MQKVNDRKYQKPVVKIEKSVPIEVTTHRTKCNGASGNHTKY